MQDDNSQLYMLLGEMRSDIKNILLAEAAHRQTTAELEDRVDNRFKEHAVRLTDLEAFRWKFAGVFALVPIVIAVVTYFLSK